MAPALRRVPARPVARWATLRLVAGWATRRPVARRVQPWRRQRAPRFGWASSPADAVVSLLDGVELVCAPPELCTIPERGSGVEASLGEEVELAWASTELCTIPDVEPEEEPAAEADEFVDDVGPVDDVLAAESDDELEADDDESDDELEELESVGSANATPGVFATAAPMPSATANTPTRTMYCAFTDIAIFLCYKGLYGRVTRLILSVVKSSYCSVRGVKVLRAIEKYLPKQ